MRHYKNTFGKLQRNKEPYIKPFEQLITKKTKKHHTGTPVKRSKNNIQRSRDAQVCSATRSLVGSMAFLLANELRVVGAKGAPRRFLFLGVKKGCPKRPVRGKMKQNQWFPTVFFLTQSLVVFFWKDVLAYKEINVD